MTSPLSTEGSLARIGAVSAPIGAGLLVVSTVLHPMGADPHDAPAAFAEYAADALWVWSHLGQFAGVAMLAMALIGLAAAFEDGRAAAWARLGLAGTVATVAVAAVLQAVDGVALKVMVERWAAASGEAREAGFEAAFAVRQVEIGLASLLNVLFGFTSAALAMAILTSSRFPVWLGVGGVLVAMAMLAAGAATAIAGFASGPMTLLMAATVLFLLWLLIAAVFMWRLAPVLGGTA